jgi:hypothetical protein
MAKKISGAKTSDAVAAVYQATLIANDIISPFSLRAESFRRQPSHFSYLPDDFSVSQVTGQTCQAIFLTRKSFCKFANPLARLRSHFSDGKTTRQACQTTWQMSEVIFLTRKSFCKFAKRVVQRKNPEKREFSRFFGGNGQNETVLTVAAPAQVRSGAKR